MDGRRRGGGREGEARDAAKVRGAERAPGREKGEREKKKSDARGPRWGRGTRKKGEGERREETEEEMRKRDAGVLYVGRECATVPATSFSNPRML